MSFAFPTNVPIVPGHTLIVPKRCITNFSDLTKDEVSAIFDLYKILKDSMKEVFQAEGSNQAWNEGKIAGQSVPYFHLHLLPRKAGDEGITEYEPRKFLYRSGSKEVSPEEKLQEVVRLLKRALK